MFAYAMTAVFLRRWLFRHAAAVASTAAIAMFLVAMGCIVPVIVAFATDPRHWDTADWWMLLNPLSLYIRPEQPRTLDQFTAQQPDHLPDLVRHHVLLNLRWFFA
ncbi:MAG: hypothetical protein R3C45_19670 [Phycisphaerales bacterium]